jgi:hypothetical protein
VRAPDARRPGGRTADAAFPRLPIRRGNRTVDGRGTGKSALHPLRRFTVRWGDTVITATGRSIGHFIAVCRCLYQATVSRQHGYSARTGLIWYTHVRTGLGSKPPTETASLQTHCTSQATPPLRLSPPVVPKPSLREPPVRHNPHRPGMSGHVMSGKVAFSIHDHYSYIAVGDSLAHSGPHQMRSLVRPCLGQKRSLRSFRLGSA